MSASSTNTSTPSVDLESLPQPPLARKIHLTYIGVVAALGIFAVAWDPILAAQLAFAVTGLRFLLVRWVTKREYGAWLQGGTAAKR